MMKRFLTLSCLLSCLLPAVAQEEIELTTDEAKSMYTTAGAHRRVSVHDPSVAYDPTNGRYYIFGSHQAWAWTDNMQDWTHIGAWWAPANNIFSDFNTNQTKTVKVGGETKTFGNFNAQAWAAAYGGDYNIADNLWAPAVIWNKKMGKWCQYLSVNGPTFNSVIILLTADNIVGPYTYQGPVVYSGFFNTGVAALSWKNTDLPLVLGSSVTSLPARYNISQWEWGNQWLNCIDPCVFYDTDDNLYMVYGSWFGGLYLLELDEATGLRDYDVKYGSDWDALGRACTRDPYYGIKVSGGFWASGEGPYIERIGKYYYLFQSNGGLNADGGYQMRVFRSENPRGPYVDSMNRPAVLTDGENNYGVNPSTRGEKIFGPYENWGFMKLGELAQGHNSVIAAPDGRTYLIYHTRFGDGGTGHQVRVHQLFVNEDGWLVAAPFEYNGETVTDADIASTQVFDEQDVAGTYNLLVHKYSIDHANLEMVNPVKITLNADGSVTGAMNGTWNLVPGTSYFHITLGATPYKGVLIDERIDGMTIRTVSFSAMSAGGVNIWGYKYQDKYSLAWYLNNYIKDNPVTNRMQLSSSIDLSVLKDDFENVTVEWTSGNPDVLTDGGACNPYHIDELTEVPLSLRIRSGKYVYSRDYTILVSPKTLPEENIMGNLIAYYNFDTTPLLNQIDGTTRAQLQQGKTSTPKPTLEEGKVRSGKVVHTSAGALQSESYVQFKNPFYERDLEEGFTVAFWAKLSEQNFTDALFAISQQNRRLFITGNTYIGFNDNQGNWIDINNPDNSKPSYNIPTYGLKAGEWTFVTLTLSRDGGFTLYTNGAKRRFTKFEAWEGETQVTRLTAYNYNLVFDHVKSCRYLYFGKGSFGGSADACYDDLLIYDRVLTSDEVAALRKVANSVFDFAEVATDIQEVNSEKLKVKAGDAVYDLQGRRVATDLQSVGRGIYIYQGKKIFVK